ncbi:MAG TPA: hypothetical protein VFE78_03845 [Gemmataceae bacterium]|nr:hypothetical protein [Gemmataceae bacterium]
MKWLLRPSLLIVASTAFVVGALAVALRTGPALTRPAPLPVADGDREIVWLYAATNPGAWERFVAAVRRAPEGLRKDHPDVRAEFSGAVAFPEHTTAVPEVALSFGPGRGRLVFRWYKLTSDWNTHDWVEALLKRAPPPLAVIGGSSSDGARDLAWQLDQAGAALPADARPLLLLTTATADRVPDPAGAGTRPPPVPALAAEEPEVTPGVALNDLYPDRTFRFCFTNRQMAGAVTHFLWSQPDLRPDYAPPYMVRWDDDSYSRDLIEGFWQALERRVEKKEFTMDVLPTPQVIDSSVGGFSRPNRFEAKVARDLLDLRQAPQQARQKRPLLVLTGQSAPSRRFLRALVRSAPDLARQFVVATGDAIAFNNVYRDRGVAWHVQDLPIPLVFFCHHNPIDSEAGFRPLPGDRVGAGPPAPRPSGSDLTAATGTEDILLYGDIVEALAQGRGGRPAANATELAAGLAEARVNGGHVGFGGEGLTLFRPDGHGRRQGGTGEHIVTFRPHVKDGRVLPEATIGVWAWHGRRGASPPAGEWRPVGEPLQVFYDQFPAEGVGHE